MECPYRTVDVVFQFVPNYKDKLVGKALLQPPIPLASTILSKARTFISALGSRHSTDIQYNLGVAQMISFASV